jgi:4-hydroxy-tetrahydrodipicolinate synthase
MKENWRHVSNLSGYAPAVPTPFGDDGRLDRGSLERFCDYQIREGATALVVCGTTGEAPTLSRSEHQDIVRIAVSVGRGRIPVIAGAGSNSTSTAILSVVPYYNKPSQAGMLTHFRAIAGSVGLPIILYDVPSRTVCGLADTTVARLAESPQFIGLKDATGDVARPLRLRGLVGPDFRLLSGDDLTVAAFIAQGGDGCISVTSNVAPSLCRALYTAVRHGRVKEAQRLSAEVTKLTVALFAETNPAPVKYALSLLGFMPARLRLPLVEPSAATKARIAEALRQVREHGAADVMGNLLTPEAPLTAHAVVH